MATETQARLPLQELLKKRGARLLRPGSRHLHPVSLLGGTGGVVSLVREWPIALALRELSGLRRLWLVRAILAEWRKVAKADPGIR